MHYTLLFYLDQSQFAARTDPTQREAFWGSFEAYVKTLQEAGVMVSGAGLRAPEAATTVRPAGRPEHRVQDGPYADTKEQLGGFLTLDVPDLDSALEWANRCPARVSSAVEVRPNLAPAL
jgi:hypothetical protein